VWKGLDHPHILRFIGLHVDESGMYLVSPWMENGHALDYVRKNPQKNHVGLLLQVAEGLEYLHNSNPSIVHGDLRGDNILISSTGEACIGDFGLSQKITLENAEEPNSTIWQRAGNARYMAPEILDAKIYEEGPRTTQTDVFALGRVMYQLLTMDKPFANTTNDYSIPALVLKGQVPPRPQDEGARTRGLSDAMWYLMNEGWLRRPARRPNATIIVSQIREIKERSVQSPFYQAASYYFSTVSSFLGW